ncbi:hypothetical protein [Streptomyces sp. enrichment culture]|uniref:hypothetical protein n=1 Tax=Streptomyces sp. enrichment culture TaxID=1795815 RepID=UPI003F56EADE
MSADRTDTSTAEQGNAGGDGQVEDIAPAASEESDATPRYTVSDAQARQVAAEALDEARRREEELIVTLPQEQQDTIREVHKQLAVGGWEVRATSHWWGFAVHLNAQAAQDVAEITEMIGEIAGNLLGGNIGKIVEAAAKIRAAVIKAVGKDYGCRLVSPWIAPSMLIPIPSAPREDTHLWWTVTGAGADHGKWSEDEKFADHRSKSNPALAVYKGKLYCVHRGDGDGRLWWTVYDPDTGWSTDTPFPNHYSASGPALAVFGDYLYCVHRGSDTSLWWTRFNGSSWSTDTKMGGRTNDGPALAVYNGKLYCAYKGYNENSLWWCSFNGSSWTGDQSFGSHRTNSNPALAVYKNNLYAMYKGHNTNTLYLARFNGSNGWHGDSPLPNHTSAEGPALAVFDDHLYCVHRGGSDRKLWWARYNGSTWSTDTHLPDHYSAQGPAIAVYRDKDGTKDQLFCVHRGS